MHSSTLLQSNVIYANSNLRRPNSDTRRERTFFIVVISIVATMRWCKWLHPDVHRSNLQFCDWRPFSRHAKLFILKDWDELGKQTLGGAPIYHLYLPFPSIRSSILQMRRIQGAPLYQPSGVQISWHACMHHSFCDLDTRASSSQTCQPCVRDLTAGPEVHSGKDRASSTETRQPCVRDPSESSTWGTE